MWFSATIVLVGAIFAFFMRHFNAASPKEIYATSASGLADSLPGVDASAPPVPMYSYSVVSVFPHDRKSFTQGLVYLDGMLLESTGLNGQSSIRKVELETGKILQHVDLSPEYFAEGLAELGGRMFQLTWQNTKCFVYNLDSLRLEKEFSYTGEGWGLTTDGQWLIMSDGTDQIRVIDPSSFAVMRTISVTNRSRPLNHLNELEYVKGEIFANIWQTQYIARIDPANGKVIGLIDLSGLLPKNDYDATTDVLNGIAYDSKSDRLFVTGKHWPKLFEIRLKPKLNS